MVRDVLTAQLDAVLGGRSIEAYHDAYAAEHSSRSLRHAAAAAEATALLRPDERDAAVQGLLQDASPARASLASRGLKLAELPAMHDTRHSAEFASCP